MRQKKSLKLKLRDILKSKLVISILIFIAVSLIAVIAGDIIVKEGAMDVSGNLTTTGIGTFGNLNVTGNIITPNSCGCGWEKGDFKMSNNSIQTNCWKVANGTGGTADLRDRFIVGAGLTYAINETGGSTSTGYNYANVYDSGHSHGIYTGSYLEAYSGSGVSFAQVPSETYYANANVADSGHTHDNSLPPFYALVYKQCMC